MALYNSLKKELKTNHFQNALVYIFFLISCVIANETGNQTQCCCLSDTVQLKLICFIYFVLIDDKFGVFLFIKHEIENGLFTLKKASDNNFSFMDKIYEEYYQEL